MARRRFARRGPKRALNWNAPAVETALTSTAAGVQRNVTLLIAPVDGVTVIRILGNIMMVPTADTNSVFHLGIQKVPEGILLQDPDLTGDVEQEGWMWWMSRFVLSSALGGGFNPSVNYPIDIRVKRKLKEDDSIIVSIVGTAAYSSTLNFRILTMAT